MRLSELTALISVALVGVLALWAGRHVAASVEAEAASRAVIALDAAGFEAVQVAADGLVLELRGRVASEAERALAGETVAGVPGVATAYNNTVVVAPMVDLRPAVLHVQKDGETFTLSGEAPNSEARDLLSARARIAEGGRELVNLMRAQDRRASDAWLLAAETVIDAVAALRVGQATIDRRQIRIVGAAANADARRAIVARLRERLGERFELDIEITSPPPLVSPYVFQVRKDDGGVDVLACAAPSPSARSVILGEMRAREARAAGERSEGDACLVANGAPNDLWPAAVSRGFEALDALAEGSVRIVDDRVELVGFVPQGADLEAARRTAADDWPAVYAVTVDIRTVLPIADPYRMTAVRRPGSARLTGFAPDPGVAEAWAIALDATNELELARGAPEGWVEAAAVVVAALAAEPVGAATIRGRSVLFAVERDESARAELADQLRARLPPGYRVDVVETRAPSETVAAAALSEPEVSDGGPAARFLARRSIDGSAEVQGDAGDATSRSVVLAYARAKLGGENLEDRLAEDGPTPPSGWSRAVFAALDALGQLDAGQVVVDRRSIFLAGQVDRGRRVRAALSLFEDKTPEGYRGVSQIRVVERGPRLEAAPVATLPPSACEDLLNETIKANPIRFASNRAAIESPADAAADPVDALAAALRRCPDAVFEVGGHTDSVGEAEDNMGLSRERAVAVRLSLIARGAAQEQLTAEGYGESAPVADNDTPEGRELNRRIEFRLLASGAEGSAGGGAGGSVEGGGEAAAED